MRASALLLATVLFPLVAGGEEVAEYRVLTGEQVCEVDSGADQRPCLNPRRVVYPPPGKNVVFVIGPSEAGQVHEIELVPHAVATSRAVLGVVGRKFPSVVQVPGIADVSVPCESPVGSGTCYRTLPFLVQPSRGKMQEAYLVRFNDEGRLILRFVTTARVGMITIFLTSMPEPGAS